MMFPSTEPIIFLDEVKRAVVEQDGELISHKGEKIEIPLITDGQCNLIFWK